MSFDELLGRIAFERWQVSLTKPYLSKSVGWNLMLRGISIENFRGIRNFNVNDLGLINVFFGENNSGKSTVLDATFWCLKEIFESSLGSVLASRVRRGVERPELFFGYSEDLEVKVKLKFDDEWYRLKVYRVKGSRTYLTPDRGSIGVGPDAYVMTFEYSKRPSAEIYICHVDGGLTPDPDHRKVSGIISPEIARYGEQTRFLYSHVTLDRLWDELDRALSDIKLKGELERDLVRRLHDVYGISGYEFVPMPIDKRRRTVAFADEASRVYGDFHGAGVQRGALILSALELMHDSALLLEEVETYQHPKSLMKLVDHMVKLAVRNNVQLFVTTHSYYDALRYFSSSCEGVWNRFRCYAISRKEDGSVSAERCEDNVSEIIRTLYPAG